MIGQINGQIKELTNTEILELKREELDKLFELRRIHAHAYDSAGKNINPIGRVLEARLKNINTEINEKSADIFIFEAMIKLSSK